MSGGRQRVVNDTPLHKFLQRLNIWLWQTSELFCGERGTDGSSHVRLVVILEFRQD